LSHVVRPAQAAGQQQLMEGSAIGQPATSAADRANSAHAAPAGAPEQQLSEHGQLAAAPQAGPKASRSRQRRERQAGQVGGGAFGGSSGSRIGVTAVAAGNGAVEGGRQRAGGPVQEAAQGAHPEAPHCLVCCSEMREVGIGACNHKQVCGTCTLRLRLCYDRRDCPLCKTELKEVSGVGWVSGWVCGVSAGALLVLVGG
jgi:hypothetical protein